MYHWHVDKGSIQTLNKKVMRLRVAVIFVQPRTKWSPFADMASAPRPLECDSTATGGNGPHSIFYNFPCHVKTTIIINSITPTFRPEPKATDICQRGNMQNLGITHFKWFLASLDNLMIKYLIHRFGTPAKMSALSRAHCGYALSKWETALHCNVVSHWLSPYPDWSLHGGVNHCYISVILWTLIIINRARHIPGYML